MKRVVYTPGVWDLLHMGHLNLIKRAKLCGDHLVVGVCSDSTTKATKGELPTINQQSRADLLAAIRYVDEVFLRLNFFFATAQFTWGDFFYPQDFLPNFF